MEEFNELFLVEYQGYPEQLNENIDGLVGVTKVSVDARFEEVEVDTQVECEIKYDAYATDRTRLSNQIEQLDGVRGVIFG